MTPQPRRPPRCRRAPRACSASGSRQSPPTSARLPRRPSQPAPRSIHSPARRAPRPLFPHATRRLLCSVRKRFCVFFIVWLSRKGELTNGRAPRIVPRRGDRSIFPESNAPSPAQPTDHVIQEEQRNKLRHRQTESVGTSLPHRRTFWARRSSPGRVARLHPRANLRPPGRPRREHAGVCTNL